MRPPGLVTAAILAAVVCFAGPAVAQPAAGAAPAPAPAPAPTVPPEAVPSAPAPAPAPASESAPPAPTAAPSVAAPAAPAASRAPAASGALVTPSLVSSPFGPPSQIGPTPTAPARPVSQQVEGRRLNEGSALLLSLGGTIGSWVLFGASLNDESPLIWLGLGGLILGPNLGHWYQGTVFTRGTGLRVVGVVSTIYGFINLAFCEGSCGDSGALFFYGGALLYLGATIDDLIDAPRRARKHNQSLEVLGLTPTVTDRSAGFAISGRF